MPHYCVYDFFVIYGGFLNESLQEAVIFTIVFFLTTTKTTNQHTGRNLFCIFVEEMLSSARTMTKN